MIEFSCPKCRTVLETSPQQAGKVIKCPDCGTGIRVPAPKKAPPGPETGIKQPSTRSVPPPAAKPQRPEGRTPGPRRPARRELAEPSRGPSPALLIGGIVGGVAVLALIGVVVVLALRSGSRDSTETAGPTPQKSSVSPVVVKNSPVINPNLQSQIKKEERSAKEDSGPPDVTSSMSAGDVYRRTLQSMAWFVVATPSGGAALGSGSLIDQPNRIILTNYHVIFFDAVFHTRTLVFFPMYENGKLVTERTRYLRRRDEDGIHGTVLEVDIQHDLALVQVARLPENIKALPLAEASVSPADPVYSVGSPGYSDSLWQSTSGAVRQVQHKAWPVALGPQTILELDSQVVITQNPVNPGDSGGPLVNDRAELVGVAESVSRVEQNMSIFIDVSEARNFIETKFQKRGWHWTRGESAVTNHAAVPDLVRYLDSSNRDFRTKAIANLGKIGSGARLAVPDLMQVLRKESDGSVRRQAVEALNKIGPPEKKDLQLLLAGLADSSADVRSYAATALGRLGRDGRIYIADILKIKKDSDVGVRQAVLRSLGQVGRYDKETVFDALKEGLQDSDRDVRVAAAESMLTLGPTAADVPTLKDCLKHQDSEVQIAGARALFNLGPEAKDAVGALLDAFKSSKDDKVRGAIITTLGQIGSAAKPAVPAILDAVKVKELRGGAMVALGKIGPEAKEAVPALADSLDDRDNRVMAINALGKIGKEAKVAIPKMAQLLSEPEKDLRLAILTALKSMGPTAKEAVADIGKCLDYKEKEVSLQGLEVLAGLGADSKAAVPDIMRLFVDEDISPNNTLRVKAVETLARIGKPAVARLRQGLKQSSRFVRIGAANALGQIGPDAKEATSSLIQMSNSPDPLVRQAATDALIRIQR